MVVACPSGAVPNASRSGYRRRSGSPRTWPLRRSPADCGCRPTRSTPGGADGEAGPVPKGPGWSSSQLVGWRSGRLAQALERGPAAPVRRRPALDPGPGLRPDRTPVPHPLHAARGLASVALHGILPAGADRRRPEGLPRCRAAPGCRSPCRFRELGKSRQLDGRRRSPW